MEIVRLKKVEKVAESSKMKEIYGNCSEIKKSRIKMTKYTELRLKTLRKITPPAMEKKIGANDCKFSRRERILGLAYTWLGKIVRI